MAGIPALGCFSFAMAGFLILVLLVRVALRNDARPRSGRRVHPPRARPTATPPRDWRCTNPQCLAINPGQARYCRMCCCPGPRCHSNG